MALRKSTAGTTHNRSVSRSPLLLKSFGLCWWMTTRLRRRHHPPFSLRTLCYMSLLYVTVCPPGVRTLMQHIYSLNGANILSQHALVVARCQLFVPGSAGPGQWNAPPWLMLKPEWTNDIQTFNQQNGVDILNLLQTFGMRMRQSSDGEEIQLFWPMDDVYIQNEPLLEEGKL